MRMFATLCFTLAVCSSAFPMQAPSHLPGGPGQEKDPAVQAALEAVSKTKADVAKAQDSLNAAKKAQREAVRNAKMAVRQSRKARRDAELAKAASGRSADAARQAKAASDAAVKAARMTPRSGKTKKAAPPATDPVGPSLFRVGNQRINRRPVPCCGPVPQGFLER